MNTPAHHSVPAALAALSLLIPSLAQALPPPPASAAVRPEWDVSTSTSALDGKTTYAALLHSLEPVADSLGNLRPAGLVVRCAPGSGLQTYIVWPLYIGSGSITVTYRFDEERLISQDWHASDGGTAEGLFGGAGGAEFLSKLSSSHRLVVQSPAYRSTPVEASFDLSGAAAVVSAARQACAQ